MGSQRTCTTATVTRTRTTSLDLSRSATAPQPGHPSRAVGRRRLSEGLPPQPGGFDSSVGQRPHAAPLLVSPQRRLSLNHARTTSGLSDEHVYDRRSFWRQGRRQTRARPSPPRWHGNSPRSTRRATEGRGAPHAQDVPPKIDGAKGGVSEVDEAVIKVAVGVESTEPRDLERNLCGSPFGIMNRLASTLPLP